MNRKYVWIFGACVILIISTITAFYRVPNRHEVKSMTFPFEKKYNTDEAVGPFAVSPDRRIIAWIAAPQIIDSNLNILKLDNGAATSLNSGDKSRTYGIAISPDGTILVAGVNKISGNCLLQIWDLRKYTFQKEIDVGKGFMTSIIFAKDGKSVYVGNECGDGILRRIDIESGKTEEVFGPQNKNDLPRNSDLSINSIALSSDGQILAIGLRTGVIVWNLKFNSVRFSIKDEKRATTTLAFSPDGKRLAVGGYSTGLWDVETGKIISDITIDGQSICVAKILFSPDSKFLVASLNSAINFPSKVAVWRIDDYSHPFSYYCHKDVTRAISFMPGTNKLVTGSDDCSICIWDLDKLSWPKEKDEK